MKLCYNAVMRHFKKRTVALCLASVVTVLGSFAAEMYTNNILDLRINNFVDGYVSVVAMTDKPYTQSILTDKINSNIYSVTFPSTNSVIRQMPDITGCKNIEAIHVTTHPATPEQPGFTKVFLKTVNDPNVAAKTILYVNNNNAGAIPGQTENMNPPASYPPPQKQASYWDTLNYSKPTQKSASKPQNTNTAPPQNDYTRKRPVNNNNEIRVEDFPIQYNEVKTETAKERWIIIIGAIVVTLLVFCIYFLSKDKMASVVGEQNDFDLNEDDDEKKKKLVLKNFRKTVNTLDKKYKSKSVKQSKTVQKEKMPESNTVSVTSGQEPPKKNDSEQIIDLDKLFNEKTKAQEKKEETSDTEDHDDLADFLSEFSFEDEMPQEKEEENSFDEELFETTIHSSNMNFSKADKDKLAVLMRNEISDELMDNVAEFVPSEPKQPEELSEREKLENILFDYTTKQDIFFTQYDVDTIKKLMNVEMETSFVNDLNVDEERTKQVQKELEENKDKPHKILEDLVLNVKELLPDLSKELAKQGNKRIESEVKPDVVYYSEGYDVSKLSVSNELADISKALESENKNDFRPSDNLPIVENGYEVETLSVKDLPDLSDVKANPQKYEEKKTKTKIDEKALLKSISNVKFRPFYEEAQEEPDKVEDLNNIDDNADDIQENVVVAEEKDSPTDIVSKVRQDNNDDVQKLIKIIEAQQAERQKKKAQAEENINEQEEEVIVEEPGITTCRIDAKRYNIVKTSSCDDTFTCCLAHDESGYDVIGERSGAYQLLRHYDSLKSENLKIRVNEKKVDGSIQYLIRIGINKFIVNVSQTGMEFVMDLC